ncbi:MAG: PKD domain-containing protein, partial [Solirubrobacteraceae bacterium]
ASTDPDGRIVRYDWDFGDGRDAPDAGPRVRHVYPTTGTRTVTLTVTDADGTSTEQLWTGARMLRNGGESAQKTRSLTIQPVPKPRLGRSVTLLAIRGRIFVRVPGSSRFVPLDILRRIPIGSIIDARKGRARVTAEVNAKTGRTESSIFYDWYFKVVQRKGRRPVTEARLVNGSFAACGRSQLTRSAHGARAAQGRRARSKKRVRRLWGRGTGNFRTSGKRSSATVRGTWWLVEDRCDGTLTRVRSGRVEVRDFRTKKTIRLRANSRRTSYLAKAP